jgi:predicted DNA-binding protein
MLLREAIRSVIRECEDKAMTVYELVATSSYDPDDYIPKHEIAKELDAMIRHGEIDRWSAAQLLKVRNIEYVIGREVKRLSRGRTVMA